MWWTDDLVSSFRNLRRKVMTNDEKRKGGLDGSMLPIVPMLAILAITSESKNKNNVESFPLSAPSSSSSTFYIIYSYK